MQNHQCDWQGQPLKRYRMLRQLSSGGMVVVWLAEDRALCRQVAIKLLPSTLTANQHYLHALDYEAQIIATLDHPHILPIHDFDKIKQTNGTIPYLVMPYISGGSLRNRLLKTDRLLPVRECLSYLRQAALAIDHAHQQQVLHRDIKPANMLLQDQWLFVTDFGLAKMVAGTTTYAGAGSPPYMAPEQARGHAETASDLYSLAVIAFELFTGQLPFQGQTPYAILMQQLMEPIPSAHSFNHSIPSQVDATLEKALAKEPAKRYPSCLAFIDALEAGWRSFIVSSADPDATILAPWSKYHPFHVQTIPIDDDSKALFMKSPLPFYPDQHLATSILSEQAASPSPSSQGQMGGSIQPISPPADPKKNSFWLGRRTLIMGGLAVLGAGALTTAGMFLTPFIQKTLTPVPGPHKLIAGIPFLTLTKPHDVTWVAVWSPDGQYLATAGANTWVMLWDLKQALLSPSKKHQTLDLPHNQWEFTNGLFKTMLSWSPNSQKLAILPSSQRIYLLEPALDSKPQEFRDIFKEADRADDSHSYRSVAWSSQEHLFATITSFENEITLWDTSDPWKPLDKLVGTSEEAPYGLSLLAWSSDDHFLATLCIGDKVLIWDMQTKKVCNDLFLPDRAGDVNGTIVITRRLLQWSPVTPNYLLVSDLDIVTIWDAPHKKLLFSLGTDDPDALTPPDPNPDGWRPNVHGVCWSPNEKYIAGTYGRSCKVYIWDLRNPSQATVKNGIQMPSLVFGERGGHTDMLLDIAWSPDGRYLATTAFDGTIIIWQVDEI